MATVIIGGLIFASVLTLILTPSILMIQARVGDWFAARRAPVGAPSGATPPRGETMAQVEGTGRA
jgi:hypothetical protein